MTIGIDQTASSGQGSARMRGRRRAGLLLGATVAGMATMLTMATPAHAANQSVHGGYVNISPTWGSVCATGHLSVTVYYTHSRIPGQEMGGDVTDQPGGGCRDFSPPVARSKFRTFHLCNGAGVCNRDDLV